MSTQSQCRDIELHTNAALNATTWTGAVQQLVYAILAASRREPEPHHITQSEFDQGEFEVARRVMREALKDRQAGSRYRTILSKVEDDVSKSVVDEILYVLFEEPL